MILLPRMLDFYNDSTSPLSSVSVRRPRVRIGYNFVKISHKNYHRIILFDIFGREARIHRPLPILEI